MEICCIPIDNRPVCYDLIKDIAAIDGSIKAVLPPVELLGGIEHNSDTTALINWLGTLKKCDNLILALDTLAYGGLIPSRRSVDTFDVIKSNLAELKRTICNNFGKKYAFSSIMRISNNNYNDEEKLYWNKYGKKIFEYSYNLDKTGHPENKGIPAEILDDYLNTRKRNFEVNKIYLEWQKEGFFDTLIFSKDDCAEYGLNVKEARLLENLGGKTKTGADEIPLSLFSRAINKDIKVFVIYTEPNFKNLISNYEDLSVEKSVSGQLELGGFTQVEKVEEADLVLYVNNFKNRQGEWVMGIDTEMFDGDITVQDKPFAVADIRYANGADNNFIEKLLQALSDNEIALNNFYGYAGWNTTANTLGSLLASVKIKFHALKYNHIAFKKLQIIRFLDDWAYQANIRQQIKVPCNIKEYMKPYEERLKKVFSLNFDAEYTYPWNRKFEIHVTLANPCELSKINSKE